MDFVKLVKETQPAQGQVALFWLGQAGFLIKTASGRTIAIDPYFTDHVRYTLNDIGFKRLTPALCGADEIEFDVLLISHEHGDHFDTEAIGPMMANGKTQVYTNTPSAVEMEKMGLDMSRIHVLKKGEKVNLLGECELLPVDCDHGELAPEALGLMMDFGHARIY